MTQPDQHPGKQLKGLLVTLGVVLIGLLGIGNHAVGQEIAFSAFYAIPISLVAWFVGRWAGLLMCGASALTLLSVALVATDSYSNTLIPYWNAGVASAFFVVIAVTLSALRNALERERSLAQRDALTGIANRRSFFELAQDEMNRARRFGRPFTVAYIDLDSFKVVNDRWGHQTGDALLRLVGDTLQREMRAIDVVARLGGDEFVILMPETAAESAETALHRLRQSLTEEMHQNQWPVTFSIGAATFATPPASVNELIQKADELMYAAKSSGRNVIKQEVVQKRK